MWLSDKWKLEQIRDEKAGRFYMTAARKYQAIEKIDLFFWLAVHWPKNFLKKKK